MRNALLRKREQVSRLRDSIAHDQENITRWRIKIGFLRPGGRSAGIHYDLELRIADVEDRIRPKESDEVVYGYPVSVTIAKTDSHLHVP